MAIRLIPCNKTITWFVRALHLIFSVFQWLHMKLQLRKRSIFSQCYGMAFHQVYNCLFLKRRDAFPCPSPSHFHIKAYYCILLVGSGMDVQKNRIEDEKEWGNLRHLAHWRKRGRRGWSREHHWEWGLKDRCPLGSTEHCFLYATLVTLFDDNSEVAAATERPATLRTLL